MRYLHLVYNLDVGFKKFNWIYANSFFLLFYVRKGYSQHKNSNRACTLHILLEWIVFLLSFFAIYFNHTIILKAKKRSTLYSSDYTGKNKKKHYAFYEKPKPNKDEFKLSE